MGSQERVRAAAKATAEIDAAIDRACAMHEHYRSRNTLGVYAHPYALGVHLAEARQAIAHAEEVVRTTPWPTDEDYDPGSIGT
jgi:hypothetical protein